MSDVQANTDGGSVELLASENTVDDESLASSESDVISVDDSDVLSDGETGNFTELKAVVGSGNVVILEKDYVNTDNVSGYIRKGNLNSFIIDGQGHTLDFKKNASGFSFDNPGSSLNVEFKNIQFKNAAGTFIYLGRDISTTAGDAVINANITNCTFANDNPDSEYGSKGLSAIHFGYGIPKNIIIKDCNFINDSGCNGGAISSGSSIRTGNMTIENCKFINNTANDYGIISFWFGINQLNIIGCDFINNGVVGGERTHAYVRTGGGVIFCGAVTNGAKINVKNSNFINSTASQANGGVFYLASDQSSESYTKFSYSLDLDNCSFINNSAGYYGGVIYGSPINHHKTFDVRHIFAYDLNIQNNCKFINNTAGACGGAIYIASPTVSNTQYRNNSWMDLKLKIKSDCLFENNSAGGGFGGAIGIGTPLRLPGSPYYVYSYSSNNNFNITVDISDNCSFVGNKVGNAGQYTNLGGGGALYIHSHANVTIDDCSFINNTHNAAASTGGGAISLGNAYRSNSNTENLFTTYLNITNTDFEGNSVTGNGNGGGAVYIASTNLEGVFENLTFNDNFINSNTGSAIHFTGNSNNTFKNITFENNEANDMYSSYWRNYPSGGAVSFSNNTNSTFENCNFTGNSANSDYYGGGGAVYFESSKGNGTSTFTNVNFVNNTGKNGGAVYVGDDWENITFEDSNFTQNTGYVGGSIYLTNSSVNLVNDSFESNNANKSGGAIYNNQGFVNVTGSSFDNNNANKSGGAIYFYENSTGEIHSSNFTNNSASNFYGGGVFVGIGSETVISDSNFVNNSAVKGSAINYQAESGVYGENQIINSTFINNTANSANLIVSLNSFTNKIEIIYIGGDNSINAIKSYYELVYDNVTYYKYGEGFVNSNGEAPDHTYNIPFQKIYLTLYDENGNVIDVVELTTDALGRAEYEVMNPDVKTVKATRYLDEYYTEISRFVETELGDFDIIQQKILTTPEGGVVTLERNYTYTIGLDSITEGIIIDRNITIDGKGFTIDALYKSRVFKILADNVTFTNISFVNSIKWDGSFIYGNGINNITIKDCYFANSPDYMNYLNPEPEVLDEDDDRITVSEGDFNGGAVYIVGNNSNTSNSEFYNLVAYHGGAMYVNGTNHTVINSKFNLTWAYWAGGSIFAIGENFTMDNLTFEDCNADTNSTEDIVPDIDGYILGRTPSIPFIPGEGGGTLPYFPGTLGDPRVDPIFPEPVTDTEFIRRGGGAVYFEGEDLNITNSTFNLCSSNSFGGAVYSKGINTQIIKSNFTNSSALSGGAVFFDTGAEESVIDECIFITNTADYNGGAVSVYSSDYVINNTLFDNNTLNSNTLNNISGGGAVYLAGDIGVIHNSNFTNNRVAFMFPNPDYHPYEEWGYDSEYDGYYYIEPNYQQYLEEVDIDDEDFIFDLYRKYSYGGAFLIRGANVNISGCRFNENYAQSGGAIAIQEVSFINTFLNPDLGSYYVNVEHSIFSDNFAQYGGAVITEDEEIYGNRITFNDCEFYNNTAYLGGTLYIVADGVSVENSVFENSSALMGGAIFDGQKITIKHTEIGKMGEITYYTTQIVGSYFEVSNSTFKHNHANYGGAILLLGENAEISQNSRFIENSYGDSYNRYAKALFDCYNLTITSDDYYSILDYSRSETDTDSGITTEFKLIENMPNLVEGYDGAIYWAGYQGNIKSVEFINNTAPNGGAIFIHNIAEEGEYDFSWIAYIYIYYSNFTDNTATYGSGGAIMSVGANGGVYLCNFENNSASMSVENDRIVNTFNECYGGAILWVGYEFYPVVSVFANNTADYGGAIALLSLYDENGELMYVPYNEGQIYYSEFINNSAISGGAVFNTVDGLIISGNFTNNSALDKGGAIYNTASDVSVSASFINNTAINNGGAIYNTGNDVVINGSNFTFNKAEMGSAVFDGSGGIYVANSQFLNNKAAAASIKITSSEVDGNNAVISAIFKANDNVINALYVLNSCMLENVSYWGADGLTNTGDVYPPISDAEAGQNITFELFNDRNPAIRYSAIAVTDINGQATVTIPNIRSGRYYAVVSHKDDNYYNETNSMTILNVGKTESPISIEINDTFYKENASAIITLNEDVTGNVTIQIDGVNFTTIDLENKNGRISLDNISGLAAGIHNITAIYNGDDSYDNSSATSKFFVKQINSTISISAVGGKYGEDVPVSVVVTENTTGNVYVTIEDKFGKTITINDTNEFEFIISTLDAGEYMIFAYYGGDNNYLSSANNTTFTIAPADLNANATASNITAQENATFEIDLPDDFNGKANITVDGISKIYNISGSSHVVFDKLAPGDKIATIQLFGDKNYNNKTLTADFTVYGTVKDNAEIIITVSDIVVVDDNVTFTVTTNSTGLVVKVNGQEAALIGENTYRFTNASKVGTYTITAETSETFTHYAGFNSTAFEVIKHNSTAVVEVDPLHYVNDTFTISVASNATVNVTVNGKAYDIDENGNVIINTAELAAGEYTVVATVYENAKYNGNVTNATFKVVKYNAEIEYINVPASDVTVGQNATITVKMANVTDGEVTIEINNANYTVAIKDGVAVMNVTLPVGKYDVKVYYLGDYKYNATNGTSNEFNVVDKNITGINITAVEVIVVDNDLVFKVVTNSCEELVVKVGETVITSTDGNYTYHADAVGTFTITAETKESAFWTVGFNSTTFTVIKHNSTAVVEVDPLHYVNDTFTISVASNATVNVTVNGKAYDIDENGNVVINTAELAAGEYIVVATVYENAKYNPNSINKTFIISKLTPSVSVAAESIAVGNPLTVNVYGPEDIDGIAIVEIDDVKYAVDIVGGTGSVKVPGLSYGNYEINAVYLENDKYLQNINKTSVDVDKVPSTVVVSADDVAYGDAAVVTVSVGENQTGFVSITVNNKEYAAEIKNQKAEFTIYDLEVNKYPITVKYFGDESHDACENSSSFSVIKADLPAKATAQNVTVDENSKFIVNVPEDFTGKVKITVDDITYDGDVKDIIEMDKLSEGNKTASVKFYGDKNYNDKTLSVKFTVSPIAPVSHDVKVSVENETSGSPVAVVEVGDGSNGTVNVTVDGKTYTVPVVNGKAVVPLDNLTPGKHEVEADFTADDGVKSAAQTIADIPKEESPIGVDIKTDGENAVITVDVPDDATGVVLVDVDGVGYYANVKDGKAVLDIPLKPGNHTVKATYMGDDKYSQASADKEIDIAKKSIATVLVVDPTFTRYATDYYANERGAMFYATLMDTDGNVLANKTVQIAVNGPIYNVTTDKDGKAGLVVNLMNANVYTYALVFSGDEMYNATHIASSKLTVIKKTTSIKASDKSFRASAKTKTVKVTLSTIKNPFDGKVYLKSGKTLKLKINGKTYKAKIDSKGVAKFKIKLTKKGKFAAKITFAGDKTYESSSKKIVVTIK